MNPSAVLCVVYILSIVTVFVAGTPVITVSPATPPVTTTISRVSATSFSSAASSCVAYGWPIEGVKIGTSTVVTYAVNVTCPAGVAVNEFSYTVSTLYGINISPNVKFADGGLVGDVSFSCTEDSPTTAIASFEIGYHNGGNMTIRVPMTLIHYGIPPSTFSASPDPNNLDAAVYRPGAAINYVLSVSNDDTTHHMYAGATSLVPTLLIWESSTSYNRQTGGQPWQQYLQGPMYAPGMNFVRSLHSLVSLVSLDSAH
jgi:hypothetical protein